MVRAVDKPGKPVVCRCRQCRQPFVAPEPRQPFAFCSNGCAVRFVTEGADWLDLTRPLRLEIGQLVLLPAYPPAAVRAGTVTKQEWVLARVVGRTGGQAEAEVLRQTGPYDPGDRLKVRAAELSNCYLVLEG